MNSVDMFMLIIFIITISIIIGLNIVALIDKKIGNVSINIPPIKIPNIIVNMDKDMKGDYSVSLQSPQNTSKQEHFDSNLSIEPYQIDNTDKINYTSQVVPSKKSEIILPVDTKENIKQIENKINEQIIQGDMNDPDDFDKIMYDGSKFTDSNVLTIDDIPDKNKKRKIVCLNESLNNRFVTGKEQLKPYSIGCNQKTTDEINPADYYKKVYNNHIMPMDDKMTAGYNYSEYSSMMKPFEIGKRLWSKPDNIKLIPQGNGYFFS